MKYSVGLIAAVAAIGCNAQAFADLPECGKVCVQDMLDKASELSCDSGDVGCLCQNPDFTYGIRDCSLEACTNDAQAIINYGAEYCKDKGAVVITTAQSGSNTGTATTSSATGTDDASQGGIPIATSTHETVVEESGSSVTSTSVETLYSTSSGASESTSGTSESTSSGASESTSGTSTGDSTSTDTSDSNEASGTESESPTETDGDGDSDGSGDSDSDGNDDSENDGSGDSENDGSGDSEDNEDGDGDEGASARMAVAPAGLLAVAGVVAFLI